MKKKRKKLSADQVASGENYKKAIESLGLSQIKAAKFLGVNDRTSRRFASGEWPVPRAAGLLLGLMVVRKIGIKSAENSYRKALL